MPPPLPVATSQFSECYVLDTGYCLALESMMVRGGRSRIVQCHSIVALLRHPQRGWMLWDAGYAPRLLSETRRLPFSLYRLATPMRIDARLSVKDQLKRFGLTADDIETVVLSHLHADHVAGVRDFPRARFVLSRKAWDDFRERQGLQALKRGYVPQLLPNDFEERAMLLPTFEGEELGTLGPTFDLWDDGSCVLMELPGHARGQIGMLVSTEPKKVFFVADGCWHRRSLRTGRAPHPASHFIVDNGREVASTVRHLREFARDYPEVVMVPTHCPEAFAELVAP